MDEKLTAEFKWVVTTTTINSSLEVWLLHCPGGAFMHLYGRQCDAVLGGWGFAVEEKLQWHAMAISQSVNFSSSDLTIL
jgi:hypothetical protein